MFPLLLLFYFSKPDILNELLQRENRVLHFWTMRKRRLDQCQQYVVFERSAKQVRPRDFVLCGWRRMAAERVDASTQRFNDLTLEMMTRIPLLKNSSFENMTADRKLAV